ncbi:hypothetical protein PAPHI01_2647 [Pancytospora philotis]|nr:hypothetical protein PAPHI01_2647 [Pancytospora philotis]
MTAEVFVGTLQVGLDATLRKYHLALDDVFLQMDKDPKHTSARARRYYREAGIRVLPWPSLSPDLNPIECVWADVKYRLRTGPRRPSNPEELVTALQEIWRETSVEFIRRLYRSMPRCLADVVRARGGNTPN